MKENSIEELLKAYKELKEIEESHRKENGELREKVKQLEEENKTLNERNLWFTFNFNEIIYTIEKAGE